MMRRKFDDYKNLPRDLQGLINIINKQEKKLGSS